MAAARKYLAGKGVLARIGSFGNGFGTTSGSSSSGPDSLNAEINVIVKSF